MMDTSKAVTTVPPTARMRPHRRCTIVASLSLSSPAAGVQSRPMPATARQNTILHVAPVNANREPAPRSASQTVMKSSARGLLYALVLNQYSMR